MITLVNLNDIEFRTAKLVLFFLSKTHSKDFSEKHFCEATFAIDFNGFLRNFSLQPTCAPPLLFPNLLQDRLHDSHLSSENLALSESPMLPNFL